METLNREYLDELRQLQEAGSSHFIRELVDLFLKESVRLVAEMRSAFERKDAEALTQIAHTLKGSSGNLGAERMSSLCARLQKLPAPLNWAEAGGLLGEVEREFPAVRDGLEAEKSR